MQSHKSSLATSYKAQTAHMHSKKGTQFPLQEEMPLTLENSH